MMIKFNEPTVTSLSRKFLNKVFDNKNFVDGHFQKKTAEIIKKKIDTKFVALTQSGTDALEVASLLLNLKKNDEVILPSYTHSSTATSFMLFGAKPVFCDIKIDDLCINLNYAEKLITKKTKAISLTHYGGNCCDMDRAIYLKKKYNIFIIEDAAHAFLSKYKNRHAGTIGDVGIFSFHQTKNFSAGQGGAIVVNNRKLIPRVNSILDKGNNISKFKTKNYPHYKWVSLGSEYRASELSSSLLYSQIKDSSKIQKKRENIFNFYLNFFEKNLNKSDVFKIIKKNDTSKHSYHAFSIIFKTTKNALRFQKFMKSNGIQVNYHYFPLHLSKGKKYRRSSCKITETIYRRLIRLPIHNDLNKNDLSLIGKKIKKFFNDSHK